MRIPSPARWPGNARRFARCVWFASTTGLFVACREVPRTYNTVAEASAPFFRDDFDRPELGDHWRPTGPGATLENGSLAIRDLKNHPLWLTTPLPDDFILEFDAWAESDEGDLKVEVAGDGRSFATSANYVASGYVLIFGGWNNTLHALCRRDEHATDRKSRTDPRLVPETRYHFTITRKGTELRWEIDGQELLTFDDPFPLRGEGHRSFAFSGWTAPVRFDNLTIVAL